MKKIMLLAFGCLVALPSLLIAQADIYTATKVVSTAVNAANSFTASQNERKFAIIEYWPGTDSVKAKYLITKVIYIKDGSISTIFAPGDTARLFLPEDGKTAMKGEVKWKNALQLYDTTFTEKERIDDPFTNPSRWSVVNMASMKPTNKPEPLYNKSFTIVNVVASASSAEIKLSGVGRIELFSEHYQGHGYVKVFVDGVQVKTLYMGSQFVDCNCYNTDFARMKPSWGMSLPMGDHTVKFQTDGGNQWVLDMIRTFTYTTKPH